MGSQYLSCFDEHGYSFTTDNYASDTRRPLGKRSLNSNAPDHSFKKYSSNWFPVKKLDNEVKSITCEEQEIFCVASMRGKNCVRFPGLTKEEFPMPILVFKIKGLGLAQDLNPNSNTTGCAIFYNEKNFASNGFDDDNDASISVWVYCFILQRVIIPFVHKLREGNPNFDIASNNDTICNCMQ